MTASAPGRPSGGRSSRFAIVRLLPLLLLVPLGCGDDDGTGPGTSEVIFPENFRDSYVLVRDCRPSIEHDLYQIQVWCDPGSAQAYVDGVYPFEEGTILVKAEYAGGCEGMPIRYSAMRKLAEGAAPAAGDWEWQRAGVDFKVLESGAPASCFGCHTGCTEGRDYACTNP